MAGFLWCPLTVDALSTCLFCLKVNPGLLILIIVIVLRRKDTKRSSVVVNPRTDNTMAKWNRTMDKQWPIKQCTETIKIEQYGKFSLSSALCNNAKLGFIRHYYIMLSCTIWKVKFNWLDILFNLYCRWPKYCFSSTPVTCYRLSVGKLVVNPVHFLLTENIKRGNQGIIVLFYYLIQNINVDRLMWLVCRVKVY